MKIGILQAGLAPDELRPKYGEYPQFFSRLLDGHGFDFASWEVVSGIFPEHVSDADGWLITGSKHGAYEDHDWIPPLEDFIREIYASNVPLVGICFGHQIIAQALGGTVEKFAGGWAVGRQTYDFDGAAITLNAWHQDQVITAPKDATTVGRSAFCEHAALIYGDKAFTVQAHPEFNNDFIVDLAEARGRGNVPDDLLNTAISHADKPVQNAELSNQIATFFKQRTLA